MIVKIYGVLATCFCLIISVYSQEAEYEFRLRGSTYNFRLAEDFKTSHFHYAEGDYFYYYRLDTIDKIDTTRLTLHYGSNVRLPHLRDTTFIVASRSDFERSGTQVNGRFWRELNLSGGVNMFYQNATNEEKDLFDLVITNLLEKIETK
jgi:hypothetical protein